MVETSGSVFDARTLNQETFADRFRERMTELGLEIEDIANRTPIGKSTLQTYLKGQLPKGDYLIILAGVLTCSLDWLLLGKKMPQGQQKTGKAPHAKHLQGTSEYKKATHGGSSVPVDIERLTAAIEAVEEGLAAINRRLASGKKAELILAAYDLMAESEDGMEKIVNFIKLVA